MKLAAMKITEFTRELASASPAPGGGSVAALAAAQAAALCAMVARLTRGKERYRQHWQAMEQVEAEADTLAARFLELVDEDTAAYNEVVTALRLPRQTDTERQARQAAIAQASRKAAAVPLATLEASTRVAELVQAVLEQGNPNCRTDAGSAAAMLWGAINAAAFNVLVNLGSINDASFTATCLQAVNEATTQTRPRLEAMVQDVLQQLQG